MGPGVFGAGPARFDASEQGDAPASASAVPFVSVGGGADESDRAAAHRAGKGSFSSLKRGAHPQKRASDPDAALSNEICLNHKKFPPSFLGLLFVFYYIISTLSQR